MANARPASSVADRFAAIMDDVCRAVPVLGARNHAAGPLVILIYTRLRRLAARFATIAARFEAGSLRAPGLAGAPGRAGLPGRAGACAFAGRRAEVPPGAPGSPRLLPGGFAWLVKLVPEAVALGTRLQHLLETDPEMAALLAAAPQAGRILRPLLWMAGVRPVPAILRRRAAGAAPSRRGRSVGPDRVAPDRVGPDRVAPRSHGGDSGQRQPCHGWPRPPEPERLRSPDARARAAYAYMNRLLGITDAPPFPA